MLKQQTDWKTQPLTALVESIRSLVDGQFDELRSALIGLGEFRLAESHERFRLTKTEWLKKNLEQQDKFFRRFRLFKMTDDKYKISTDGHSKIVAPRTHGKKKNINLKGKLMYGQ